MRIEGAIFDLDGTLTDSMYIWNEAPKALVRKFGGKPPEDLARDIREMGRREASEYMVDTFCLPCTPEQVMEGVNALVTGEYRDRVPMKTGADTLLERLGALGVPCGIATASEAFQARDAIFPGWTPRISWQHWSGAEPGMERVRPGEEGQRSTVRDGRQTVPNTAKMGAAVRPPSRGAAQRSGCGPERRKGAQ